MGRDQCACGCDGCRGARLAWIDALFGRDRRRTRKEKKGGHCGRAYKGCAA